VSKKGKVGLLVNICLVLVLAALTFVGACTTPSTPGSTPSTPSTPGSTPTGPAPAVIRLGGAVPLTGGYAAGGNELRFGYEQAVRDINAKGGIYVKEYDAKLPVTIRLLDDESDPTKTVSRMEALASVDKVICYVGSYSSETNAPAAGIAEKNKIPIVAGSFSSISPHEQGYKYLFSPFVKTPEGLEDIFSLLDTIPAAKRPTKIAVWAEKTDWGEELREMTPDVARSHGYTVVVNEMYSEMTLDFSSLIIAAKAAGAEVVLAVPTPVVAITMMKQIRELDYNPGAVVFWRGASTALWAANLMATGDYALFVSNWSWNFGYPGCKELVDIYRAAEGKLPTVTVGNGYAIVQIIADAIERAGSLDPAKIRDAIASTKDLMTVQGLIKEFRADGVGVCPSAVMQWQNQITQVVYHELYVSAPLIYPAPKWSERK